MKNNIDSNMNVVIIEELTKLITELKNNGKASEKEYEALKDYLKNIGIMLHRSKNKTINSVYDYIINDYLRAVKGISMLVPGLATSIKDYNTGITLETYSGKTTDNGNSIDENTRFDYASMTKMFTSIEELKMMESGIFDNKRKIKEFKGGKYNLNIPASSLERFTTSLRTNGRIDVDLTKDEFERRLTGISENKDAVYEYNDIPYIILKDIMPSDDDYFKKYYQDEMNLLNTSYKKFGEMTGGNSLEIDRPYDPKAKNLMKFGYNEPGHAGMFGTSRDLVSLGEKLKAGFLSTESLKELTRKGLPLVTSITLSNGSTRYVNRAMGVYIKHPDGLTHGEVVPVLSDNAFTAEGSSGGYSTYDLQNGFTANILANPYSRKESSILKVDNSAYLLSDNGKLFDDNALIKLYGKQFELLDKNGDPIYQKVDGEVVLDKNGQPKSVTVPYSRITNTLKYAQIYTLIGLRFASNVYTRLYKEFIDDRLKNELESSSLANNTKKVMHI